MKTKSGLISWALGICFMAAPALADHQGGTPLETLRLETNELNQLVQSSGMRYAVKSAVYQFNIDVQQLGRCATGSFQPVAEEVSRDHDHDGGLIPPGCQQSLRHARQTFYTVDRFLYDSNFDYPSVYAAYLDTRNALYVLR